MTLIIRQKGESQNEGYKKTDHAKFSEKWTFFSLFLLRAQDVSFLENMAFFAFL